MKRVEGRVYELENERDDRRFTVQVAKSNYKDGAKWKSGGYFLEVLKGKPGKGKVHEGKSRKW